MSAGRAQTESATRACRITAGSPVTRDGGTSSRWLAELLLRRMHPSDLRNRDPAFIKKIGPLLYLIGDRYFRAEAEGTHHIPEGPFIGVGNHGGAPLLPDVVVIAGWWVTQIGVERPIYIMVHDFPFRVPIVNNVLMKAGALPASQDNAHRVLKSGASVVCFPGGDLDCLRSFRERNRVDLHGNTGFVKLAFTYGVPIVPFVNIGGHEVYFTLFSGRRLAQWTGLETHTRVKAVPLIVGLPWGVWLTGFLPYLPLPSKLVYKVAEPIVVDRDPDRAHDPVAVERTYRLVVGVMQDMLDDLARRRQFPIIG